MTRNESETAATDSMDADSELNESELSVSDAELPSELLATGDDNAIEKALHQFVTALKQEFASERARERAKIRQAFTRHARKIEVEARKVVRERVAQVRKRDQKKIIEREKRINDLFRNLNFLARDIALQKQQLKKSREELERKLMESDFVQTELRNIGQKIGKQVDTLGDSLLDEGVLEETMPGVPEISNKKIA